MEMLLLITIGYSVCEILGLVLVWQLFRTLFDVEDSLWEFVQYNVFEGRLLSRLLVVSGPVLLLASLIGWGGVGVLWLGYQLQPSNR